MWHFIVFGVIYYAFNSNTITIEIPIEELWQKAKRKYSFPEEMQLKNEQSEILKCILEGKDCFVSLSTGFERSLCFMLPPLLKKEV